MEDESLNLCSLEKILTSESHEGEDRQCKMFAKFHLKENLEFGSLLLLLLVCLHGQLQLINKLLLSIP
jgi:hypothetical protein